MNKVLFLFSIDTEGNVLNLFFEYNVWLKIDDAAGGPWCFSSIGNKPNATNGISTPSLHVSEGFEVSTNVGGTLTFYPSQCP